MTVSDWLEYKQKRLSADKEADKSRPVNKKAYREALNKDFSWMDEADLTDKTERDEALLKAVLQLMPEAMRLVKEGHTDYTDTDAIAFDYNKIPGLPLYRGMKSDPDAKEQTKDINADYIAELMLEPLIDYKIYDKAIDLLMEHLTDEQIKSLGIEDKERRQQIDDLKYLFYKQEKSDQLDKPMPDEVYRGTPGIDMDSEPDLKNALNRIGDGSKITFVSPDPSTAAAYSRDNNHKFERYGSKPSYFGDKIYRIRTKGLDPEKYKYDSTASPSEVLYGPQYYYDDDVPNEEIEITDSAGNTRKVPRVESVNFNSDRRLKESIIGGKYGFSN